MKILFPVKNFEEQIQNDPNIWLGESKEVILKLDKNAKEYFFRKENTKQLSNH